MRRLLAVAVLLATAMITVGPLQPAAAAALPAAQININFIGTQPPAAAKKAFAFAEARWESMLSSTVPIEVDLEWVPMGGYSLGHAGPYTTQVMTVTPNIMVPFALVNADKGVDLYPAMPDITGKFNSALPNWYFGIDGRTPSNKIDFVSVVMHELGHGLGIAGSMTKTSSGYGRWGSAPSYYASVYDRFPVNGAGKRLMSYTNNSLALGSQLTGGSLYWGGPKGIAYNGGVRPRLHAPKTFVYGTSYSHLNEASYRTGANTLMTPSITTGQRAHSPGPITLGMLRDMGWKLGPAGQTLVDRLTLQYAALSDRLISVGESTTVRGVLRRAETGASVAGEPVTLYQRRVGTATWTKVLTKNTSTTGGVAFVTRPGDDMVFQLRHPRTTATDADVSPLVTVRVS